jgi:ribosomal-protein-serine acetyltransferase
MAEQEHKTHNNPILIPLFDALRGERVVVRPYREEDAQVLQEAVEESREHIRPWLPFSYQHQNIEESLIWINEQRAQWILRKNMNCGIFDAATDRFLGGAGLMVRNWDIPYLEIGYWLRASVEGKGYMSEAVRLLTNYALEELGAKRVEIRCDELNTRSANVARRLGYVQEALLHNNFLAPDGRVRNTLIFAITDDGRRTAEDQLTSSVVRRLSSQT